MIVEEVNSTPSTTRNGVSRYRELLLDFMHSDKKAVKVVCKYKAEAQNVAKRLKSWLSPDENIIVTQRGYEVYLMKNYQ